MVALAFKFSPLILLEIFLVDSIANNSKMIYLETGD